MTIAAGHSATRLRQAEFLAGLRFEKTVSPTVRAAAAKGDLGPFLTRWYREQAVIRQPSHFAKSYELWTSWSIGSLGEVAGDRRVEGLLLAQRQHDQRLAGAARKAVGVRSAARTTTTTRKAPPKRAIHAPAAALALVRQTAEALTTTPHGIAWSPLELLAGLELLTRFPTQLPAALLPDLFERTATAARAYCTDAAAAGHTPTDGPVDAALLLNSEIPFLAGLLFQGIQGPWPTRKSLQKQFRYALDESCDSDGTPHATVLPRLAWLLAPLIRGSLWAECFRDGANGPAGDLWSPDARSLLKSLIEQSIGLARADGRLAHALDEMSASLRILTVGAQLVGIGPKDVPGGLLQGLLEPRSLKKTTSAPRMAMSSSQSDWSMVAAMRSDWSAAGDLCTVAHHQPHPQLELSGLGRPLLAGAWGLQLQVGQPAVELADEWSAVCWNSDEDGDFLELQMQGPKKLFVERFAMLSRQDRFLVLSESVRGARGLKAEPHAAITAVTRLSLAAGLSWAIDQHKREFSILQGTKRVARCFPLALPMEKLYGTPHRYEIDGQTLMLTWSTPADGFVAPLVIDWHPDRLKSATQWRSLTVTENGRVVSPDVASGYRLRAGDLQLLVYRSLKEAELPRALLGHHTNRETVIARVTKTGDVEPLLLVE